MHASRVLWASAITAKWSIDPPEIVLNQTPKTQFGEVASPVCFDLAKRLKKPPGGAES
jgi:arginyl-tRNA synthetase